MMQLDLQEVVARILRYVFLGLVTAFAGVYLIKGAKLEEVLMVALTVAASLALLDTAGMGSAARLGLGAKLCASLSGLPPTF